MENADLGRLVVGGKAGQWETRVTQTRRHLHPSQSTSVWYPHRGSCYPGCYAGSNPPIPTGEKARQQRDHLSHSIPPHISFPLHSPSYLFPTPFPLISLSHSIPPHISFPLHSPSYLFPTPFPLISLSHSIPPHISFPLHSPSYLFPTPFPLISLSHSIPPHISFPYINGSKVAYVGYKEAFICLSGDLNVFRHPLPPAQWEEGRGRRGGGWYN